MNKFPWISRAIRNSPHYSSAGSTINEADRSIHQSSRDLYTGNTIIAPPIQQEAWGYLSRTNSRCPCVLIPSGMCFNLYGHTVVSLIVPHFSFRIADGGRSTRVTVCVERRCVRTFQRCFCSWGIGCLVISWVRIKKTAETRLCASRASVE